MSTPEEIFAAAAALAPNDKWLLVTKIWATLPPEAWEPPGDAELAEVQRRSAEFDAGLVEPVGKSEVLKVIRDRVASHG